ncbi:MAG TPA: energy-coupling factor ABC transporter ATP-binding protein [Parachlamydiaceae bacterium]|nr:energy-coupling factor ABC transporter ATP-binding protein [Parachlamydiaceae bacterium]
MKGLSLDAMTFFFPNAKEPFFEGLSLHFPAGKLHFIQGKNGSGKSTLLRILQGMIMPNEKLTVVLSLNAEQATIHNNSLPVRITQKIKTVVQDTDDMLANQFTVKQNLQCAQLPLHPSLGSLPAAHDFLFLLEEFGIRMDQQVSQLSGGQRQILAILMILQKPTEVLLLDEPTAALDPTNASMIINFLNQLAFKKNLIVIIISHDAELVRTYCSGSHFEIYHEDSGIRRLRIINLC